MYQPNPTRHKATIQSVNWYKNTVPGDLMGRPMLAVENEIRNRSKSIIDLKALTVWMYNNNSNAANRIS